MTTVKLDQGAPAFARVTLTRSERRNAINPQMAEEFSAAVAAIAAAGTHVALLDAEGPAFCAGADLGDLQGGGDALYAMLETLLSAPIHWTAVVSGAVRGAGLSLLAACPRVLAVPEATFGLPELPRGFFPTSVVDGLATVIGTRDAYELAFGAQAVDAYAAERMGLVSAVISDAEIDAQARVELGQLAGFDADALQFGITRWQASTRGLLDSDALRAQ